MDDPPGNKLEKRKKRRWNRKPEVTSWFNMTMGACNLSIVWPVPHITFREAQKSDSCVSKPTRRNDKDKRTNRRRPTHV
jgi:hypothetical protein